MIKKYLKKQFKRKLIKRTVISLLVFWVYFASGVFITLLDSKIMDYELMNLVVGYMEENYKAFIFIIGISFVTITWIIMTIYDNVRLIKQADMFDSIFNDDEILVLPNEYKEIEIKLNEKKMEAIKMSKLAQMEEKRKNDLIMYLAHDLKTPLTSVIGYIELVKNEPDLPIEKQTKYLNIAYEKANQLESLINEFFDLTKVKIGNIELNKTNFNLKFLLEQVVDDFYPSANEKNITILISEEDVNINADAEKLARVFNNILKNAIAYSYIDSTLYITNTLENNTITISIRNEGSKIPEEKLETIFEKFFRLDDSRNTKTGGAGLGLAIAKEIVLAHNGSINAESNDNYTQFNVSLPLNLK